VFAPNRKAAETKKIKKIINCVSTEAKLLSAQVRSDMSPLTRGTVCPVQFEIVTLSALLNLNLKRTF